MRASRRIRQETLCRRRKCRRVRIAAVVHALCTPLRCNTTTPRDTKSIYMLAINGDGWAANGSNNLTGRK